MSYCYKTIRATRRSKKTGQLRTTLTRKRVKVVDSEHLIRFLKNPYQAAKELALVNTILYQLHQIERRARIYNIHWCSAGVGIQFYEPPPGYTDYPGDGEWRRYLVTRRYYPTFEEAVCAEYDRIFVGRKG